MTSIYEKKSFGRGTVHSCRTNIFIKAKGVKQDILNKWKSMGFLKLLGLPKVSRKLCLRESGRDRIKKGFQR